MKKYLKIIVLFLCIFIFSNKVNAEVYQITNSSSKLGFYPSGTYSVDFGVLYTNQVAGSLNQIYANFESIGSDKEDNNPVLYDGRYLVEFILYGTPSSLDNFSCSYLNSNFKNINMTSGSLVSNEISSTCIDTMTTTYNGKKAVRLLYMFDYATKSGSSGVTEFRFTITSSKGSLNYGSVGVGQYALMVTNLQTYNQQVVDDFAQTRLEHVQLEQNQTIIDQNNETNTLIGGESDDITSKSCGMICKLKAVINFINPLSENFFAYKLVELMLNMLKSLFIPENMDFVTDFVDALESKLGFIASIPVKIIEFTMSLATATWSEFKSIQLPSISIFGYNFWNAQEIDLTEAINIFKPFKYVTDVICVVICAQTLNKWRERFTGGGSDK